MAIVTENKAAPVAEKILANLLSSLKNGAANAVSTNGGFATLLAETTSSFGHNKEYLDDQASTRREADPIVRDVSDEKRSRADQRVCSQQDRDDAAPAPVAQESKEVKETETENKQEAASVDEETEASSEPAETVETQEQEAVVSIGPKKTDEAEEDTIDEDILALLATLVPLDGEVSKKDAEIAAAPTAEQALATPDTKNMEKPIEVLQNLLEIRQQIAQSDPTPKPEGDVSSGKVKGLSNALEQLMHNMGITKETPVQNAKGTTGAGEEATAEITPDLLSGTIETAAETVPSSKPSAAQDMLDFLRKQGRQQAAEMQTTQTAAPSAQQAVTAAVSATANAVQGVVDGSSAATSTQSGGTTSPTTQGIAAGGMKTAGIYDFASQLSAVRVTKGGATGLPQAVEQVAVQLHKAVKEGIDEMTIRLKPAELGKIEIKLAFGADNTVTGTVVADNQSTLNMLQKDSDSLHRALQEAGLQADAGSLEFSLRDNSGSSQFSNQMQDNSGAGGIASNSQGSDAVSLDPSVAQESYYLTPSRVNIHV